MSEARQAIDKVTSSPFLPVTEEFPGMWDFQCLNQEVLGKSR